MNARNVLKSVVLMKKLLSYMFIVLLGMASFILLSKRVSALWVDREDYISSVGTLDIDLGFNEEKLSLSDAESFLPGDVKVFNFKIRNTGAISVDISPIIRIESSKPMSYGESEYLLCNALGESLISQFTMKYYLNGECISDSEESPKEGTLYDTVVYQRKELNTLCGSRHNDEDLDLDEESGMLINEKSYDYAVMLSKTADNEFMGSDLSLIVEAFGIQHRLRASGEGIDDIGRKEQASASIAVSD